MLPSTRHYLIHVSSVEASWKCQTGIRAVPMPVHCAVFDDAPTRRNWFTASNACCVLASGLTMLVARALAPFPSYCTGTAERNCDSLLLFCSSSMLSNGSPNAALRTTDQLNEVISMARCLLPAIPDSSNVMLEDLPACPSPNSGKCITVAGRWILIACMFQA